MNNIKKVIRFFVYLVLAVSINYSILHFIFDNEFGFSLTASLCCSVLFYVAGCINAQRVYLDKPKLVSQKYFKQLLYRLLITIPFIIVAIIIVFIMNGFSNNSEVISVCVLSSLAIGMFSYNPQHIRYY